MLAAIFDVILPATTAIVVSLGVMVFTALLFRLVRFLGRRSELASDLVKHAHLPTQTLLAIIAARIILVRYSKGDWVAPTRHVLLLALIAAVAWLLAALMLTVEETALERYRVDVSDNMRARRVHTQVSLVRRITIMVVSVLAVGAMLVTFPQARAAGTSVLASAGLVGIITALAAKSFFSNIIAGLQLAFGDALRLDDVVVVEGEWGRIEEMTLSYVVVKIWDERRLILPTEYFTTKPFQNWTRTSASVLGTIELDVDWTVPLDEMRAELERVVHGSELWDGRVCGLQVTNATGGYIQARALISAADSGKQWDLRCLVREALVTWVRREHPQSLPRMRAELAGADLQSSVTIPRQPNRQSAGRLG